MKKKMAKFTSIFGLLMASTIVSPIAMSCSQKLGYTNGDISDSEGQSGQDNQSFTGNLSPEFENIKNNNENKSLHLMNVSNEVSFLDYKLDEHDDKNVYKYIHERGGLDTKKITINLKQNKDDFLQSFKYNEYLEKYNNAIKDASLKMQPPSTQGFLNDIYYWVMNAYYQNKSNFDLAVSKSEINYDANDNTLSFRIIFYINNPSDKTISINIGGESFVLDPQQSTSLILSAEKQPIKNQINVYNNRYFYAWNLANVNVKIGRVKDFNIANFNPCISSHSYAYMLEFLNLTDDQIIDGTSETAKAFMDNLTPDVIKENLERTFMENTDKSFRTFANLSTIFNSLAKDPTVGIFLYETADALSTLLSDFGIIPVDLQPVIADFIKTVYTGEGVLSVFEKHKKSLSTTLKRLLEPMLGPLTDLIDMVLLKIKPEMDQEDLKGIMELLDTIYPQENETRKMINKIIGTIFGEYDENGNKVQKGNPYVLDLIEYFLNYDELNNILNAFVGTDLGVEKEVFEAFKTIYLKIVSRTRNEDNSTTIHHSAVFDYKMITLLFDIRYTAGDPNKASWWLMDQLIIIMNSFGFNVGNNESFLLFQLLQQTFGHKYNRDNLNDTNVIVALKEIANAFTFLSNRDNFNIKGSFTKFNDDNSDVKYWIEDGKYYFDFNYHYSFEFKKKYTFNFDVVLNVLPTDVFIEMYKIIGEEWYHYKWWEFVFGFYTKERYVTVNLERILYRMFPRKLAFEAGDSFNMDYKTNSKRLIYSQNMFENKYYHGFNSILDVEAYFEQKESNKGIISNLISTAFDYPDVYELRRDNNLDKAPPGLTSGVVGYINYESGPNRQSTQNMASIQEITSKLFANKMTFSVNLIGYDKTQEIKDAKDGNVYYKDQTFKWNDTDINEETVVFGSKPKFKSKKYDEYSNMFKYKNDNKWHAYHYLANTKGDLIYGAMQRQQAYLEDQDIKTLQNDLFTLGKGVNMDNTLISIKPLVDFSVNKKVTIVGGAEIPVIGLITPINLELEINIELLAMQATIMTPNKVLNLSHMTRKGDDYKLYYYNYSNVFDQIYIAPRISVKIPNF